METTQNRGVVPNTAANKKQKKPHTLVGGVVIAVVWGSLRGWGHCDAGDRGLNIWGRERGVVVGDGELLRDCKMQRGGTRVVASGGEGL